MMKLVRTLAAVGCATVISGCGSDSSVVCGAGTIESDGECVPEVTGTEDTTAPVTTADPSDGVIAANGVAVTLTVNEAATIYYTTDGTAPTTSSASAIGVAFVSGVGDGDELRFFAVDAAGNEESVNTLSLSLDGTGPSPVQNLRASVSGSDVTLTWDNPTDADFAGVVVGLSPNGEAPVANPTDGLAYVTGDVLPGGDTVLLAGDATMATDTPIGSRTYAVWATDTVGNFSSAVTVRAALPLTAQTATLTVDRDAGTVTVTTQPANFDLTPIGYVHDTPGNVVRFGLSVTNKTDGVVFALKALMTASEGTLNGDGTFQGTDYMRYGPEGVPAGYTKFAEISLDGVVATTGTFTIDVVLRTDPVMMMRDDITDSATGDQADTDPDGSMLQNAVSRDGLRAMFADKNNDQISVIDTTRPDAEFEIDIPATNPNAVHSGGVAIIGNHGYVAITDGAHSWGGDGDNSGSDADGTPSAVRLFRLDLRDLSFQGILELAAADTSRPIAKYIARTDDDSKVAVLITRHSGGTSEAWIIDTKTFTIVDADPVMAGMQPVQLSAGVGAIQQATWTPNGNRLLVTYRNDSAFDGSSSGSSMNIAGGDFSTPPPIDVVDISDFTVSQIAAPGSSLAGTGVTVRGGSVYYGTRGGLYKIPAAGGAAVQVTLPFTEVSGVVFAPGGNHYFVSGTNFDSCETVRVDASNDTVVNLANGDSSISECGRPHGSFGPISQ